MKKQKAFVFPMRSENALSASLLTPLDFGPLVSLDFDRCGRFVSMRETFGRASGRVGRPAPSAFSQTLNESLSHDALFLPQL